MPQRVLAYHLIMSAYGFWLPNDPRGSWSTFVGSWELFRHGGATKINDKRSRAHDLHDQAWRKATQRSLQHSPVRFNGLQARAIGRGFAHYARQSGCVIHACSIMPDHMHMVIARHTCSIEMVANLLKGAASRQLRQEGLHPFAELPYANGRLPTPWTRNQWSCFLDSVADIRRAIRYTNANPPKEHLRYQNWQFVTRFKAS